MKRQPALAILNWQKKFMHLFGSVLTLSRLRGRIGVGAASASLLLASVFLSGCGFHLRGSTVHDSMPFKSIFIVIPDTSARSA